MACPGASTRRFERRRQTGCVGHSAELLFERSKLGMSVRELYALEQPETLIENLLSAQDVTVLAAKPKAGKTNLVVGLLAENFNRGTWLVVRNL